MEDALVETWRMRGRHLEDAWWTPGGCVGGHLEDALVDTWRVRWWTAGGCAGGRLGKPM
jgi:hypothetical protein